MKILVTSPDMLQWDAFVVIAQQGHTVEALEAVEGYDLVIGPSAWHLTKLHLPWLHVALKSAKTRAPRKGRPTTRKKKETTP